MGTWTTSNWYANDFNVGCYYYDGKYYRNASSLTGFGWVNPQVWSWRYEGGFYYVDWGWFDYRSATTFTAKLAYKTIDGQGYWSLYTNQKA